MHETATEKIDPLKVAANLMLFAPNMDLRTEGYVANMKRAMHRGAELIRQLDKLCNGQQDALKEAAEEITRLKAQLSMHRAKANGEYWAWQGDGEDHLESLTCPVLIPAESLRKLRDDLMHAAEAIVEDTAKLFQESGRLTTALHANRCHPDWSYLVLATICLNASTN